MRDLGVIVDSKLSFEQHIRSIVSKANRMLGFLMRTCKQFYRIEPLLTIYCTIVRPLLEYNSPVWSPFYEIHTKTLDSMQNRFTRYIFRKFHYPYEPSDMRNLRLELKSLMDRRDMNDAMTLHKLVHGTIDCELTEDINIRCNLRTRNMNTFTLSTARTNVGRQEPLYRMCHAYNTHLSHIDIFREHKDFKREVRRHFGHSAWVGRRRMFCFEFFMFKLS